MTALLIASKELAELFRDKKNIALNMISIFAVVISFMAVSIWAYPELININSSRIPIAANADVVNSIELQNNIYIIHKLQVNEIVDEVKNGKCKLGVIWDKQRGVITFVQKEEREQDVRNPLIMLVKENIKNNIQSASSSERILPYVATVEKNVPIDYEFVILKFSAGFIAALILFFSPRINNSNAFYLSTKEKSSGTLEILLMSPAKTSNIIFGKWIANFVSCLTMTIIIYMFLLLIFLILPEILFKTHLNLLPKIPFTLMSFILFTAVLSLLQITLGFFAKSRKQMQVYFIYVPLILFIPVLISLNVDVALNTLKDNLTWIDFIPVTNFYEIIKMTVLAKYNVIKLVVALSTNAVLVLVCLIVLCKRFNSEKILFFSD